MLILVSPSCGGKDYVTGKLLETGRFSKVMSTTTRPIREKEVDGVDYWFVTKEQFETMIANGELFEYEQFMGKFYGKRHSDLDSVMATGNIPVSIMEPKGAKKVSELLKQQGKSVTTLFLQCSIDIVNERFSERFSKDIVKHEDDPEKIVEYYAGRLASSFINEPSWVDFHEWDLIAPTMTDPSQTKDYLTKLEMYLKGEKNSGSLKTAEKEDYIAIDSRFELPYKARVKELLGNAASGLRDGALGPDDLINYLKHGLMNDQNTIKNRNSRLNQGINYEI